ncbi:hypothetical protein AUEXF2481DRAFT_411375 [Aureobasidium subglaciale EXF-2481]|uniref:Uncharacterized protein n=1 Tax=Aureobasidium subglaciale (strain EXF-2481) TaxID=1043005 RepID=A0A074Y4D7_AURSE|nr:uncharacterized protein AUEXF2481DRAFT_411375 [Aureobasidium subglaciale EXF-2481]KAI5210764.1 hypothetical protein E4T38_01866 [Aureobasidium subglaciale]KAI5229248.1 hypothetical protein E4T40_01613 [Aureobasidium subglaciale]KAI5232971.1 hypothetical protein E4T41_01864 [Aureobasidium subglaciale]KAI5266252.1 hypothetical protein E4T46_01610 [Aureobasidium subglaciale]KEQ92618.1 hypothetical protein AUEXF2481DRAFT_411375 [Aureobasidium subglaciale EXF-2481]
MALQDLTDVIDRVWFWITKSDKEIVPNKIAAAYNQKGGWEGWAQVEIAYLIQTKYNNVTIDREVNVYSGTKKENDFVITDKGNPPKPKQIIELKCERGTQSAAQFVQSFSDDITKIHNLPINPSYKPAKAYAVAIVCTVLTQQLMINTAWQVKVNRIQCGQTGILIFWNELDIV